MEIDPRIQPGLHLEEKYPVEEAHLAVHVGSGSLRVLATPWMIARMEMLSHQLLKAFLPDSASSVGVMVNVQHLAPTPLRDVLRVRCEIVEVNGREVLLEVKAWDEHELVGEGLHKRVIIDTERFLRRAAAKAPDKTR
jgi:fluoroacetyl-CoA thioesterase